MKTYTARLYSLPRLVTGPKGLPLAFVISPVPSSAPETGRGDRGVRATLCGMTHDHIGGTLSVGQRDSELNECLSQGLDEVNFPATGTTAADQSSLSVKVVDDAGELVGGLAAWTWGGLLGIEMFWIREESRKDGWGTKILMAAEEEARRRGCDRACVSSFTFQAPGFYQRHGYAETGRTLGFPNGAEDVHMFKKLA
ncbi:GNAT family N-acetyltransferase [Streptomyces atacamensis]|uniref:GNAT family N-acetyltransferase n=1 Tax=Streptomyces atacamensis TaxID=531966 RepID=UPI00399C7FE1